MAVKDQVITENYAIYNGDCISGMQEMPDNSVDLFVYSPPFSGDGRQGGLYHYSSSPRDLSNNRSYKEFLEHYRFCVEQTARLLKPGRISAVHCMDVPKDGANICAYTDFPGDIIKMHEELGFEYLPRISIWKEPLAVRNRTMSKSLAHRQIVEDSTLTNVAAADYLIPFRKRGENKTPVTHPHGFLRYVGEKQMPHDIKRFRGWTGNQIENRFSHWIWRNYASSIWDDIRVENVLPYKESKDPEDERHVHPLQLDVIERAVLMWSNPGEVVATPFLGVGSEAYGAVINGRKGIGWELKSSYFKQAIKNLAAARSVTGDEEPDLFTESLVEE